MSVISNFYCPLPSLPALIGKFRDSRDGKGQQATVPVCGSKHWGKSLKMAIETAGTANLILKGVRVCVRVIWMRVCVCVYTREFAVPLVPAVPRKETI